MMETVRTNRQENSIEREENKFHVTVCWKKVKMAKVANNHKSTFILLVYWTWFKGGLTIWILVKFHT